MTTEVLIGAAFGLCIVHAVTNIIIFGAILKWLRTQAKSILTLQRTVEELCIRALNDHVADIKARHEASKTNIELGH